MSKNDRPKPRLAPPPAAVAATQAEALERLRALDDWTEEAANVPRTPSLAPAAAAAAPVQPVLPAETTNTVEVETLPNPEPARVVPEMPAAGPVAAPEALVAPIGAETPTTSPEALAARFTAPTPEPKPEVPKRPWEIPGEKETHPYHTIMSERLFQKIDYAWKRSGNRSAKEFVLNALEKAADQALRDLGIEP